jgi:hypothetical protein
MHFAARYFVSRIVEQDSNEIFFPMRSEDEAIL